MTYNEASLSSGISGEYAPQSVTVIEEREGNWIKVYTALGYKWVCLIDKKFRLIETLLLMMLLSGLRIY